MPVGQPAYYANNSATLGEADGYRMFGSGTWVNITKAVYDANNYTAPRPTGTGTARGLRCSQTVYNTNNTTPDESDGYRRRVGVGELGAHPQAGVRRQQHHVNDADGYRRLPVNTSAWLGITNAEYTARNTDQ